MKKQFYWATAGIFIVIICISVYFGLIKKSHNIAPKSNAAEGADRREQPNKEDEKPNTQNDDLNNDDLNKPEGVLPGFKALDFKLKDLLGKEVSLSDYKDKTILINFWRMGSNESMELLSKLQEVNNSIAKPQNLVILTVNWKDNTNTIEKFIKDSKYDFTVLLDLQGEVSEKYNIHNFPNTFLVNSEGIIENLWTSDFNTQEILDRINMQR